eukprot:3083257-Prorocentrum_lima.AAC.1
MEGERGRKRAREKETWGAWSKETKLLFCAMPRGVFSPMSTVPLSPAKKSGVVDWRVLPIS